jgi:uncharacterized membrane protein YbaN (DUF454 family)
MDLMEKKSNQPSMIKKKLLVIAGVISLSLGVVGMAVPILPTTPFLLLAAACFLRGSDRLYQWLMNHRFFGEYIRNFREYKAIPLHSKILMIGLLWITILFSIIFVVDSIYIRILLACIAIAVTAHILHFKTLEIKSKVKQPKSRKQEH